MGCPKDHIASNSKIQTLHLGYQVCQVPNVPITNEATRLASSPSHSSSPRFPEPTSPSSCSGLCRLSMSTVPTPSESACGSFPVLAGANHSRRPSLLFARPQSPWVQLVVRSVSTKPTSCMLYETYLSLASLGSEWIVILAFIIYNDHLPRGCDLHGVNTHVVFPSHWRSGWLHGAHFNTFASYLIPKAFKCTGGTIV